MLRLLDSLGPGRLHQKDLRVSLLDQLRSAPTDPQAWSSFVALYRGAICGWCRRWGLQPTDAEDVAQDVLVTLTVRLRHFRHDPRRNFRAWLKTVTRHQLQRFVVKRRKAGIATGGDALDTRLAGLEAREDYLEHLQQTFDTEALRRAAARVRSRVDPKTWQAFYLLAAERCSGAEVARHLGMEIGTVFVARSRVQRMLREEITRLGQDHATAGR